MFSNRKTFLILGALVFPGMAGLRAQVPAAAPAQAPAPAGAPAAGAVPMDLPALKEAARAAEEKLPSPKVKVQSFFELSPVEQEHWRKFLPQTLQKLTRRERVQIVVLGDEVLDGLAASSGQDPLLRSFAGVFASKLAAQFYYTGGARVLRAGAKPRNRDAMVMGPEILLQPVRVSGMAAAASALSTEGLRGQPDVVLVALGLQDSLAGVPAADVQAGLSSLLDTARNKRLEVIVAGPIPQAADPEEASLALTRGTSNVLRDACAKAEVLFSDLGDLSRLVEVSTSAQGPDQVFPVLVHEVQNLLSTPGAGGAALPSAAMHAAMGRILFQDVMQGAPAVAWQTGAAKATLKGQGKLALEFELTNTRKEELALTVLPLVPTGVSPKDATAEIKLAAGAKQKVQVEYAISDSRSLPLADGILRLPVLVVAGAQSRIEDLAMPLQPFSVAVNTRTAFNQETHFTPDIEIENATGAKFSAEWESTWAGKPQTGRVELEASGSEVLKLALPLPTEGRPLRRVQPLKLVVNSGGVKQSFDRQVELTRNMGLKETVPLTAADGQESSVTVRADADGTKLFFTLDLAGVSLADDEKGSAYELLLNLDARSYGERLTPGATAALRITGKAADGAATVSPIPAWAFGSGYAAEFDPTEIQATLSSSASGGRRLTISFPKSYLYLHEWALGNGNSQLGVNVRFSGGGRDYFLTRSSRSGDDAEGLSVLELTDKPTLRWTVRVE
jgi:hypothetical protein